MYSDAVGATRGVLEAMILEEERFLAKNPLPVDGNSSIPIKVDYVTSKSRLAKLKTMYKTAPAAPLHVTPEMRALLEAIQNDLVSQAIVDDEFKKPGANKGALVGQADELRKRLREEKVRYAAMAEVDWPMLPQSRGATMEELDAQIKVERGFLMRIMRRGTEMGRDATSIMKKGITVERSIVNERLQKLQAMYDELARGLDPEAFDAAKAASIDQFNAQYPAGKENGPWKSRYPDAGATGQVETPSTQTEPAYRV